MPNGDSEKTDIIDMENSDSILKGLELEERQLNIELKKAQISSLKAQIAWVGSNANANVHVDNNVNVQATSISGRPPASVNTDNPQFTSSPLVQIGGKSLQLQC